MTTGYKGGRTIRPVAYDEDLAERLGEFLDSEPHLTQKKMFGGMAFLISGNLAIAASGQGGVLVRVDPAKSDKLVGTSGAEVAVMRGGGRWTAGCGFLRAPPNQSTTHQMGDHWRGLCQVSSSQEELAHDADEARSTASGGPHRGA